MNFAEILNMAGDKIRVSEGKYSIDDVMKYAMNDVSQGHRCNTHRRVREQFSLKAPERASFPGSGPTAPVATADEIDHLLALLPAVARPIGRPRTRRPASKRSILGDSLYVMRTSFDAEHVKIGRSRDVAARRATLESGWFFFAWKSSSFFPGRDTWRAACTRTWTVVAAAWEQVANGLPSRWPKQPVSLRGRCSKRVQRTRVDREVGSRCRALGISEV